MCFYLKVAIIGVFETRCDLCALCVLCAFGWDGLGWGVIVKIFIPKVKIAVLKNLLLIGKNTCHKASDSVL